MEKSKLVDDGQEGNGLEVIDKFLNEHHAQIAIRQIYQIVTEAIEQSKALPVADGEGEKATMKELVKKIFGDEAAEDKDIVDFYERVHKTAIETGNPPSLLAAATQKRDLLFDVLSSYERRIEIRAAALAFIKAYDELLDELLEIT